MAYSHLTAQDNIGTSATTSVGVAYPNPTQFGNLLIATVYASGVGLGTPAISGWNLAINESFLSLVDASAIFYLIATGTETTITATCSGATAMGLAIHEFSTGPIQAVQTLLDQTNTATTTIGTSLNMGSITPIQTNELVVWSVAFPTGGTSAPAVPGGTVMSSNGNMMDAFLVDQNVNALAPTITWTGASTSGGAVASFFVGSQADTGGGNAYARHPIVGNGMSTSGESN